MNLNGLRRNLSGINGLECVGCQRAWRHSICSQLTINFDSRRGINGASHLPDRERR